MGRKVIAALALASAALALHFALRGLDWPGLKVQLAALDWRWLALAVLFDVASYVAQGLRWRMLLAGASLWQTTRAIYAGLFVNEVIPFRPGEALRAWLAARDLRTDVWKVIPTMAAERIIDGVWLAVALMAACRIAPLPRNVTHSIWILAAAMAVVTLVAGRFARTIGGCLRNPKALLISAGLLAGQGAAFWAVMRASHLTIGVAAGFVVMLVVRLATIVPLAPANLGAHQFATVLALSLYGVPRVEAAGVSLVVFGILTLPLLLLGFFAVLSSGVTWRQMRQAE